MLASSIVLFIFISTIFYFSKKYNKQWNQTLFVYRDSHYKDSLTRLANRHALEAHLSQQFAYAQRKRLILSVIVMDIDRLREINEALGHQSGDLVLQEFANFLMKQRKSDFVARLGGDEFALVTLAEYFDQVLFIIDRLRSFAYEEINAQNIPLRVDFSIGVASYPTHCEVASDLIKRAHAAMHYAKENKLDFGVYDPAQQKFSQQRIQLLNKVKAAVEQKELCLYFQPQVDFKSGQVVSAEALVRWPSSHDGVVHQPAEFLSLIEQTKLITPFTHHIINLGIQQASNWLSLYNISISINLSAQNLLDDDLIPLIKSLLVSNSLPAEKLTFEITETVLMQQPQKSMEKLNAISQLGCKLALDDFGTGYTSLAYLQHLPVDEIKIDQSFIRAMRENKSKAIVNMIMNLSQEFSLKSVAEGVEDEETCLVLSKMGCTLGQGYYFSKPLPANEFASWITQWNLQYSSFMNHI